jgi:hypothetical protein
MKRFVAILAVSLAGALPAVSQSLEDLNIQIHGYATQGFLYTTNNNIFTTNSSNGSPAWTEAVVNVGAQPIPKLRVGVQARYFLLGNEGNDITLDWAAADYKVNDKFGVRFGKVKTPSGLFNEIQDIDPSYMWSLLPQGNYLLVSRNSQLAHYGGVVYGTLNLGHSAGKLEYRGFGGERVVSPTDGYFINYIERGTTFGNGEHSAIYGGALHWKTPLPGLMIGASNIRNGPTSTPAFTAAAPSGYTLAWLSYNQSSYFARYEKNRLMVAGEYGKGPFEVVVAINGVVRNTLRFDQREWYGMASYKVTDKFTFGLYQSQTVNHQAVLGPARYQKDWALSGRYDLGQYIYIKAEEHLLDGTLLNYDLTLNPNGAKTTSKLTILKVGVSF